MPQRIEPIDDTIGSHGLGNIPPEPIDTVYDRPGVVQPDGALDGAEAARPVVGPETLETIAAESVLHPLPLDTVSVESVEHPAPLEYAAADSVFHPAPLDTVPAESVTQLAPLDSAPALGIDSSAALESESHAAYASAPLAPLEHPAAPPVEQAPLIFPETPDRPFYNYDRHVNYDGPLYHSPHWMI